VAAAAALTATQQRLAELPAGTLPDKADCKVLLGTWGTPTVSAKQLTGDINRAAILQAPVAALHALVEVDPGANAAAQLAALRGWALAKSKDELGLPLTKRVRELLDALRPDHTVAGAKAPKREQLLHMCLDPSFTPRTRVLKRARGGGGLGEGGGGDSDDPDSDEEKSEGADAAPLGPAAGLWDVALAASAAKPPDRQLYARRTRCRLLLEVEVLNGTPGGGIHVALLAAVPMFESLPAGKATNRIFLSGMQPPEFKADVLGRYAEALGLGTTPSGDAWGTLVVGPYADTDSLAMHFGGRGRQVIALKKKVPRAGDDENAGAATAAGSGGGAPLAPSTRENLAGAVLLSGHLSDSQPTPVERQTGAAS